MKKPNRDELFYQNYQRNLIRATVTGNVGINNRDKLVKAYGADAAGTEVLRRLKQQSKFTLAWYPIFIILGIICIIIDPSCWFNVLDMYILMVNIDLVARGKLVGIVIGIIECLLYAFICYKTQLYGEIVKMFCISIPLNTISLISWIRLNKKKKTSKKYSDSNDDSQIEVKKLTKKQFMFFISLWVVVTGASYCLLRFVLGQTTSLIFGSMTLGASIIGKILTSKKYMDSYLLYIIGDTLMMAMWVQTLITAPEFTMNDFSMIIYMLSCVSMDVYAYVLWKDMYRKVSIDGTGFLLARRELNITRIKKLKHQFTSLTWDREVDETKNS